MKKFLVAAAVLAISFSGAEAMAGYMMKIDGDTFATFGAKARIQYVMTNPDANHDRVNQNLKEARLYIKGQINNTVKFFFNRDMTAFSVPAGRGTDAAIVFDFGKHLKVQAGTYRMAISRVGLQDSYQYILINGPEVVSANYVRGTEDGSLIPGSLGGFRNEGVTVWGDVLGGKLRYNAGVWVDNHPVNNFPAIGTNANDDLGLSGRVVFNFLDPEKGYGCPGCYIGKAKVANVGAGILTWDYIDTGGNEKTWTVTAIDGFYDAGGVTAEVGLLMYDPDTGVKPKGTYAEAAYVIADKLQPAVRFETWDADVAGGDYDKIVIGVNYLFDGQKAKIGLELNKKDPEVGVEVDTATLQAQIQF